LGVASFTLPAFLLGAAVGGVLEGGAVGVFHFGVPCALVALVVAQALVSPPSGR
jgi:hypothetical protein